MSNPTKPTFTAFVHDHRLVISQTDDGRARTRCVLDLRKKPDFFVEGGKAVCRYTDGREVELITDQAASHDLVGAVALAIQESTRTRKNTWRWVGAVSIALLVGGAYWWKSVPATQPQTSSAVVSAIVASSARPAPAIAPAAASAPAAAPALTQDEWSLPASKKAEVMKNMAMAADRHAFTVDYSTGHKRTLYVFADPSCPNCQRLEPVLEAVSNEFNVVVFPVAVIGRDRSIASVTKVLCLPQEQRKSAWTSLFDPGRDGLSAGKSAGTSPTDVDSEACEMAKGALAINEVAYKSYRIPGTPWVIADDGRHVSQDTLRDPVKLSSFMAAEGVVNGAE